MTHIICSICKAEDDVPFEPRPDALVLCNKCVQLKRLVEKDKKTRNLPVRKKYGMRMTIPIVCAACGKEAVLDHKPKGAALHELKCQDCLAQTLGQNSTWADIQREREEENRLVWDIKCSECGRVEQVNFKPRRGSTYECSRCFQDQAEPSRERLEGREKVHEDVKDVFIRKRTQRT